MHRKERVPITFPGHQSTLERPLQVVRRPIASLTPYAGNPRTHSKNQIRQLAESLRVFGFTNPILIDESGGIIAGHGRVEAAKLLGLDTVPTICLEQMTEAHKRTYILADNKLAENAGWDQALLAIEFQYLNTLDLEFDVTVTGFETPEIDLLIDGLDSSPDDPAADVIPDHDPSVPPVNQPGDLWELGRHRLLCGNATQSTAFEHLLEGEKAQMVFIDPPYNVPIAGHVCGLGSIQHPDFAMASGEMSEAEFTTFLATLLGHLIAHSEEGAIHYICMDWRHLYELLTVARSTYTEIKNLCVWNKTNGGMGSFYRSKHELVLVAKHGTQPHINNFELGQHGRYRTNVWDYPGVNAFGEGRQEDLAMHPTVKPVALVADAIKDCSHHQGMVLDGCAGSGTTVIAAEQTGRRAYAMELDPRYVDTALHRWETYAGQEVTHVATGLTFTQIQEERHYGE